jgi:glycosyltransferase involved in cell wall biosynthesis
MISVICNHLNLFKYAPLTLQSIKNQNFIDYEIIVIDAGSDNYNLDSLKKYCQSNKKIRIIQQIDDGPNYGYNTGIMQSKGDILLFVNISDYIEPNLFKRALSYFETDQDILSVAGGYNHLTESGEILKKQIYKKRFANFADLTNYYLPHLSSIFTKKEVFQRYGLFSTDRILKRCTTTDFIKFYFNTLNDKKKILFDDLIYCNYLKHENNSRPKEIRKFYLVSARRKTCRKMYQKFNKLLCEKEKYALLTEDLKYKLKICIYAKDILRFFKTIIQIYKISNLKNLIRVINIVFKTYISDYFRMTEKF